MRTATLSKRVRRFVGLLILIVFVKFTEGQSFRLTDVETYIDGNERKYLGIWKPGTGAHYLWSSDWNSFSAKCTELENQNLRLTDIEVFDEPEGRRFLGVWNEGSYPFGFYVNLTWDELINKCNELAPRNLRLSSVSSYTENGARKYTAIWNTRSSKSSEG